MDPETARAIATVWGAKARLELFKAHAAKLAREKAEQAKMAAILEKQKEQAAIGQTEAEIAAEEQAEQERREQVQAAIRAAQAATSITRAVTPLAQRQAGMAILLKTAMLLRRKAKEPPLRVPLNLAELAQFNSERARLVSNKPLSGDRRLPIPFSGVGADIPDNFR